MSKNERFAGAVSNRQFNAITCPLAHETDYGPLQQSAIEGLTLVLPSVSCLRTELHWLFTYLLVLTDLCSEASVSALPEHVVLVQAWKYLVALGSLPRGVW